ncbi:MAG TPA: efflux RND transporter permease subunit [Gammaproteobacteria bacterium]|nr:efflux RND transporter permease subunit [Gammaproteobacteria bacterium]
MNLVQAALRRPITVLVLAIAVVLGAALALARMPRDIFPTLGIPTIYVAQPYGGMDPAQMEGYLTYYYEYHFLYITGIEHVESKSIQGAAIMKLQFYPGTDMNQAMAETVGYVNRARAFMPPGTVPPFITRFDAGSVPVGNLVFTSETRSVAQMQDAALNQVRPLFATLPGVSAPPPFGGSARTILINVDPERLRSYNMAPDEIVAAITRANLISPSGNMAVSGKYPMVPLNSVVKNIKDLESVPIRTGTYPTVFVRDVGQVVDGSDIVTSYALIDGRRTVYIPVTKRADASTLAVVNLVKENLPRFQAAVPEGVKVSYEFDQSPYVTRAIDGLTVEGALGALLTGVMVLLFLADWRSALIVVINIPLALTGALLALWLTGQTVNIMTLGGLALAIGVLVDMSTVAIENVHTHLAAGKRVARAVLDSGTEVALPLLIAMLCVLAVFVPSFFMEGAARGMFLPLSLAVGFAMVASYLLSSTLVPILSVWFLRGHEHGAAGVSAGSRFARLQRRYAGLAERTVRLRWLTVGAYVVASAIVIAAAARYVGTEIFPKVDTGQIQVRLRAPTGTRVEDTEATALRALDIIKNEAGPDNVKITLAFVGVHAPNYPINLIYLWNGGSEEGVLQVQLKDGTGIRTEALKERLRTLFAEKMPGVSFSFEPSDIVSQVMSLGASTPIEIAVSGPSLAANREFATRVRERLARIPALRDVQLGQALDYPTLDVNVSRERAGLMGVDMTEVSRSLVSATSSSRFVVPNYWADPNSGVAYQIQVQIPQAAMSSVEELENIPIANSEGQPVLLRSVASVTEGTAPGQYERYNMQRTITVTANLEGDLGTIAGEVRAALAELGSPPPRVTVALRGQVVPMEQMLGSLRDGLLLAVVAIFLLLAANFQSLKLALVVVSTVPAVIAGVAIVLVVTGTTLNIQSFMGAIMGIGVAVANAILLVTFAERGRLAGSAAAAAAVESARSRLRPILMTSLAMIAGMLPLAIGLGEGGEQTAPLGRAVVGGLAAATLATLLVLPSVFAIVQGRAHRRSPSLDPDAAEGATP